METFNDFLNEAVLNELGDGGTMDALATGFARKVGNIGNKMKAKLGSTKAKGTLNLNQMMAELEDGFKTYCAEQKINPAHAAVEDFLEFLRHGYGFAITDETFDGLAYGAMAKKDAEDEPEIMELVGKITQGLEDRKSVEAELKALAGYAKGNGGNECLARKSLWQLARANPHVSSFSKVQPSVGRPVAQNFKQLCQQIASLILKLGKGGGSGRGSNSTKTDEIVSDPQELEIGEVPYVDEVDLIREGLRSPVWATMAQYGLPLAMAQKIAQGVADHEAEDSPKEMERYARQLSILSRNQAINVCRVLLQAFRRDNRDLLPTRFFPKHPDLQAGRGNIMQVNHPNNYDRDKKVYDGSEMNLTLAKYLRTPEDARSAVICLLGCFLRATKSTAAA